MNKASNMIFKASLNHPRCLFIALLLINVSALHVWNHVITGIKVMKYYLENMSDFSKWFIAHAVNVQCYHV